MLTVRLAQIADGGHLEAKGIRLEAAELGLSEGFQNAPVLADYSLDRLGLKVFGRLGAKARLRLSCSRCLAEHEEPAAVEFKVLFEPSPAQETPASEEAQADEGSAFYRAETLELGEEIRQELELLVPYAPLCKADCRGLCAACGADLNQVECEHVKRET